MIIVRKVVNVNVNRNVKSEKSRMTVREAR